MPECTRTSHRFSADCLETLEEIAVQNREFFLEAGGEKYEYIPALNDAPEHIDMMVSLVTFRSVIKCRNVLVLLTASLKEKLPVLHRDLLQRFQAIGREARRHYLNMLHAFLAEHFEGGAKPGVFP